MSRAKTKDELRHDAAENYRQLMEFIDGMTERERSTEFDFSDDLTKKEQHWGRDRNLRDIYVHLYEWQLLMLDFLKNNLEEGLKASFLPEPYTWKTYGEMNWELWKKHQHTTEEEARRLFEKSHAEVMEAIEDFSDAELFEKRHYDWTGTTNLGSYFISVMPSHYDWALKKLKVHRKCCEK